MQICLAGRISRSCNVQTKPWSLLDVLGPDYNNDLEWEVEQKAVRNTQFGRMGLMLQARWAQRKEIYVKMTDTTERQSCTLVGQHKKCTLRGYCPPSEDPGCKNAKSLETHSFKSECLRRLSLEGTQFKQPPRWYFLRLSHTGIQGMLHPWYKWAMMS